MPARGVRVQIVYKYNARVYSRNNFTKKMKIMNHVGGQAQRRRSTKNDTSGYGRRRRELTDERRILLLKISKHRVASISFWLSEI